MAKCNGMNCGIDLSVDPSARHSDECLAQHAAAIAGGKFVKSDTAQKVACCEPTQEEEALLAAGDYTPEELLGGSKPTCPKCSQKMSVDTDSCPSCGQCNHRSVCNVCGDEWSVEQNLDAKI